MPIYNERPLWLFTFISLFLLLVIAFRGSSLLAYGSVNVGYSWLNHSSIVPDEYLQQAAQKAFQYAVRLKGKGAPHGTARRGLGHIYAAQHKEQEAAAMWLLAAGDINMINEIYRWAVISESRSDRDEALVWYRRALLLSPDNADAWYFAARLLEADGDVAAASIYYRASLDAGQFYQVGQSDAAFRLAELAYAYDALEEARRWLDLALAISDFRVDGEQGSAYYLRGEVFRLQEKTALALFDYQLALKYKPGHYWAHIRLAQTVWLVEGNLDEAERLLRQAVSIDPSRKWAYRSLGDLYRESNRVLKAAEMYRNVLLIDPDDAVATSHLDELEQDVD